METETKFTIGLILGIILFILGIVWSVMWMENKKCLAAYSNFEPQWSFFSKCRIMIDGKLTPTEIVRELK